MLTITTYRDDAGLESYSLDGEIKDHDGETFPVGELSFKAATIEASAAYYCAQFDGVTIQRLTINN